MTVERVGVLKHMRLCVVFAGSLACLQAVLWIILTMMGVILYKECPENKPKFDDFFGSLLKAMYFTDEACFVGSPIGLAIPGITNSFQILVWQGIYMGISVFWLISSVLLIIYVTWERAASSLVYIYAWSLFTIAMSIVDLALGSIMGRDMYQISKFVSENGILDENAAFVLTLVKLCAGLLMTVVLRGYILWIVNVSSAVYLFACILEINKGLSKGQANNGLQHNTMARGPIGAYDSNIERRSSQWLAGAGSMERPQLRQPRPYATPHGPGETNPSYLNSTHALNSYNKEPASPPEAKLMPWERAAQREPYTPSPDYSPPSTRVARSALKPVPAPQLPANYSNFYKR